MRIVDPDFAILDRPTRDDALKKIEIVGRICYKSEHKITDDSASKFVGMLARRGHTSMLEHVSATIKFIADRGFTHELVRHRLASYAQESTRYCDYSGQLEVICPFEKVGKKYDLWRYSVDIAERYYGWLRENGVSPQIARSVLPICTKSEIVITADLTEWLHIFRLRTAPAAHPLMRELMSRVYKNFRHWMPEVFGYE